MNAFELGAAALRDAVAASRVTVRLVGVGGQAHLICEALAEGVPTMLTSAGLDPTEYPTYVYLNSARDVLVQDDTRIAAVAPPPDLIAVHDVQAQMLAPLVIDERLVGTVSIHMVGTTRRWAPSDRHALEQFCTRIEHALRLVDCGMRTDSDSQPAEH